MQTKQKEKFIAESKILTQYILQGYTNDIIAQKMNYSIYTIGNRVKNLIHRYDAKNRYEFVLKILNKTVKLFKKKITLNEAYIDELEKRNEKMFLIIAKLVENENNKEINSYWLKKARSCIENST